MKLLVLAGGFGTRLKSVLSKTPKALAPINKVPFLYYQILNWKRQGIREFVFLLHFQAKMIISFLESEKLGILKNCKLQYIIEPKPLGTGGSIKYCIEKLSIKKIFLVTNADTWLDFGIIEMKNTDSPCILVTKVKNSERYGRIVMKNNYVLSFEEKTSENSAGLINAGLAILNPKLFDSEFSSSFSLEKTFFPKLVKKKLLRGLELNTFFIDIGIPKDYYRFIEKVKKQKIK